MLSMHSAQGHSDIQERKELGYSRQRKELCPYGRPVRYAPERLSERLVEVPFPLSVDDCRRHRNFLHLADIQPQEKGSHLFPSLYGLLSEQVASPAFSQPAVAEV